MMIKSKSEVVAEVHEIDVSFKGEAVPRFRWLLSVVRYKDGYTAGHAHITSDVKEVLVRAAEALKEIGVAHRIDVADVKERAARREARRLKSLAGLEEAIARAESHLAAGGPSSEWWQNMLAKLQASRAERLAEAPLQPAVATLQPSGEMAVTA